MATYNDFINAANAAGLIERFSEQDLQTAQKSPEYGMSLLSLLQDGNKAKTTEQQLLATEAANTLRKNYGVYSGADGNYARSDGSKISSPTGITDAYQNALKEVAEQQPFNYDTDDDPAWSAYKKQYLREGERASANVLAQISAATGGLPSSYAVTAAQQAANYYAAQLTDMIPTLQQNAYTQYLNEVNRKLSALEALRDNYDLQTEAVAGSGTGTGIGNNVGVITGDNTGTGTGIRATSVPSSTVEEVKKIYTGGIVTNQAYWEFLKALYGEEALRAAGISRYNTSTARKLEGAIIESHPGNHNFNQNTTMHGLR